MVLCAQMLLKTLIRVWCHPRTKLEQTRFSEHSWRVEDL